MKVSGTIESVTNQVTGAKQDGTSWVKQEFTIALDGGGNYPDRLLVTAFGERVADVQGLRPGQHVTALIDFKVSEFNGRQYNNVNLYKFETEAQPQPAQPAQPERPAAQETDGLPF